MDKMNDQRWNINVDSSSDEDDNDQSSTNSTVDDDDDDNNSIDCELEESRRRFVSKVDFKRQNDCFDLVDTSEDEEDEKQDDDEEGEDDDDDDVILVSRGRSNKRIGNDWITLDDSVSSQCNSESESESESDRNIGSDDNEEEDDDDVQCYKSDNYEEENKNKPIVLSSDEEESLASTMSNCTPSSSSDATSSNWTKTRLKGTIYYTLPKSVQIVSTINEGKQVQHPDIYLPSKLYKKMYEHQRLGVEWISSLHVKGIGGILGDDMGLGKTIQTLSLLGGLMISKTIRNAIVICPKSLLLNWEREARDVLERHCCLRVNISVVDSNMRQERRESLLMQALNCSTSRPHLIISTYGLVKTSTLQFVGGGRNDAYYWDYCILDEGHQIKNPNTQQHKSCSRICASKHTRRLLLTGTPIQNNTKELWALFHWATDGRLLGSLKRFHNQFAIPIENGRNKSASIWTLKTAERANQRLQGILKPHFLQRMKNAEFAKCLSKKQEFVVWTHLSDRQRQLYETYIADSGKVSAVLTGEVRSPLEAITHLKKLCDHPLLVSNDKVSEQSIVKESGKLETLVQLVDSFRRDGHKCLIFSPSTKILDIIESVLSIKSARIDGSISGKARQSLVDKFNEEYSDIKAMLLSTKAAGCGLNLTSADRAIIFSPSWNPADDSQAVDRCYRIGQMKNVVVYRFITAGTVEERMYEKQVHKDGIRRTLTTNSGCATERHFNEEDLRKMFDLKPRGVCELLDIMKKVKTPLDDFNQVVGVSSHDSVYYRTVIDVDNLTEVNPFSRTPVVESKKKSRSVITPSQTSDLISKITGLSLSSDQRQDDNHNPDQSNKENTFMSVVKTENGDFRNCQSTGEKPELMSKVTNMFDKIDKLSAEGKIEESLLMLLQVLEKGELEGQQKLQVHKKITSRALLYLEWHKGLS